MTKTLYDKRVEVRLTKTELEQAQAKAKRLKLSLSRAFVKSFLSDEKMLTAEEREEVQQLRFEVRKIAVNLNQIAKSLHANWFVSEEPRPMQEINEVIVQASQSLDILLRKLTK